MQRFPALDPVRISEVIEVWALLGSLFVALLMVSRVPYPKMTRRRADRQTALRSPDPGGHLRLHPGGGHRDRAGPDLLGLRLRHPGPGRLVAHRHPRGRSGARAGEVAYLPDASARLKSYH